MGGGKFSLVSKTVMAEAGEPSTGGAEGQENTDAIFNIETFLDGVLLNKGKEEVISRFSKQQCDIIMLRLHSKKGRLTQSGEAPSMIC